MGQEPIPAGGEYLWAAFTRLHGRRGSNGFGPSPLSWPDLDAFNRMSRINLAPWEVEIIEALDRVYLTHVAEASKDRPSTPPKS